MDRAVRYSLWTEMIRALHLRARLTLSASHIVHRWRYHLRVSKFTSLSMPNLEGHLLLRGAMGLALIEYNLESTNYTRCILVRPSRAVTLDTLSTGLGGAAQV